MLNSRIAKRHFRVPAVLMALLFAFFFLIPADAFADDENGGDKTASYEVTYELEHMAASGDEVAYAGEDFEVDLIPDDGYAAPDEIEVYVNGELLTEGEDYYYDPWNSGSDDEDEDFDDEDEDFDDEDEDFDDEDEDFDDEDEDFDDEDEDFDDEDEDFDDEDEDFDDEDEDFDDEDEDYYTDYPAFLLIYGDAITGPVLIRASADELEYLEDEGVPMSAPEPLSGPPMDKGFDYATASGAGGAAGPAESADASAAKDHSPKTGDMDTLPVLIAMLLSGFCLTAMLQKRRSTK